MLLFVGTLTVTVIEVPGAVDELIDGENVMLPLTIERSVKIAMPLVRPAASVPPWHVEVCAASYAASVTVCFKWIVFEMSIEDNTSKTNTGIQIANSVRTEPRRSVERRCFAKQDIETVQT